MSKTAFSARHQHVLSFSHWAHHFLAIFSKAHEFVQNSVFSPRSARTVIFALGAPLFNSFQQSAGVCPKSKTALLARDQHVLSFSHCAHYLLAIFSKVHEFVQNSVFSPRSACFVIFGLGKPLLSVLSKVHECLQKSVFSRRSARFVIFALSAPLFSNFQQRASVCPKQRFLPDISTFPHFRTGCTTFKDVRANCFCASLLRTQFTS